MSNDKSDKADKSEKCNAKVLDRLYEVIVSRRSVTAEASDR